jgi:integrase
MHHQFLGRDISQVARFCCLLRVVLRPHDLSHHAITKLVESSEASEQTVRAIAGHVSTEMLRHYSHVWLEARRKAVAALNNVTITAQLAKWKAEADERQRLELKQSAPVSNALGGH